LGGDRSKIADQYPHASQRHGKSRPDGGDSVAQTDGMPIFHSSIMLQRGRWKKEVAIRLGQ
jgi:hypothetical protein